VRPDRDHRRRPDRPRGDAGAAERLGLAREATLDEVFLDATGRTRTHVAGEVQEVLG
jgi:hypothetical protein